MLLEVEGTHSRFVAQHATAVPSQNASKVFTVGDTNLLFCHCATWRRVRRQQSAPRVSGEGKCATLPCDLATLLLSLIEAHWGWKVAMHHRMCDLKSSHLRLSTAASSSYRQSTFVGPGPHGNDYGQSCQRGQVFFCERQTWERARDNQATILQLVSFFLTCNARPEVRLRHPSSWTVASVKLSQRLILLGRSNNASNESDDNSRKRQPPKQRQSRLADHLYAILRPTRSVAKSCHQQFPGWRSSLAGFSILGFAVLLVDISALIWAAAHLDDAHFATLKIHSCKNIGRWSSSVQLGINMLSAGLLAGSNYCMQCLSSPTRPEIDAAHEKNTYLNVGILSWRNVTSVRKRRMLLLSALAVNSLLLHSMYAFYSTQKTNKLTCIGTALPSLSRVLCRPTIWSSLLLRFLMAAHGPRVLTTTIRKPTNDYSAFKIWLSMGKSGTEISGRTSLGPSAKSIRFSNLIAEVYCLSQQTLTARHSRAKSLNAPHPLCITRVRYSNTIIRFLDNNMGL
jgi:hypothetical protein